MPQYPPPVILRGSRDVITQRHQGGNYESRPKGGLNTFASRIRASRPVQQVPA